MRWLRAHPVIVTVAAITIAAGSVAAIAAAYGFGAFADAWTRPHFVWLALIVCAEILAIPSYAAAYHVMARWGDGPRLRPALLLRVVMAGFGSFAAASGFGLDQRAKRAIEGDEHFATVRVLGMGSLEWAVLGPAAWATAVLLLAVGDGRVMPSVLWPWAIAVPLGMALAFWLAVPARRDRMFAGSGRGRPAIRRALHGVCIVRDIARHGRRDWLAWVGMGLYWAFDVAAFYGACRFIGLRLSGGETIIAYATGYALTRRSMPFGGAGVTEAFLTFSLHWVGQAVAPALAAVVVYRVLNFALPAVPALLVRRRIHPLLAAADHGRRATEGERRHAAAPLGGQLRDRRA